VIETVVMYALLFVLWLEPTFGAAVSTGIKGVSLANMAIALIILGWLLSNAFRRQNFQWSSLNKYIIALVWIVAMSIPYKVLNGEFRRVSILQEIVAFKGWLEPFMLFVLIYHLARSKMIIKRITFALMAVVVLSAVVTLLVVTKVALIGALQFEHGGYWPVFAEPNQYAAYLVFMFPLFMSYTLFGGSFRGRIASALSSVAIICALVASGSRGGLLSFLVSIFVLFFLIRAFKDKATKGIIAAVGILIILVSVSFIALPSWLGQRTTARVEVKEGADLNQYSSGRLDIWKSSFSFFLKQPLFGLGLNGYHDKIEEITGSSSNSHNNYLQYLADHGIIGFVFFVFLILALLRSSLKGLRETKDDFGIILFSGFFAGMVGLSVAIFFVVLLHLWSLIMVYCAVTIRYAQLDSDEKTDLRPMHGLAAANGLDNDPKEMVGG
jgi:O-antigen ligase